MNRSGVHIDHVALADLDPVQQLLHPDFADGVFNFRLGCAGVQTYSYRCSWFGVEYVPALGLSTWLTLAHGYVIIGMHLDRKLVVREKKLNQQWKAGWSRVVFTQKLP